MPSQNFPEVVGRAVLDADFRTALLKAPRETCEAAGLPLEAAEYERLAELDLENLVQAAADIQGMGGQAG